MNKKLITIGTLGAMLIFSSNESFGQEIANVLKTKKTFPQIEQLDKEISDTLNHSAISKQEYEEQKYKIMKKIGNKDSKNNRKNKKEFEALLEKYLSNIEKQIIQNPELQKHELEMLYFDCEFADIQTPEKLELMLKKYGSRIIN